MWGSRLGGREGDKIMLRLLMNECEGSDGCRIF